MILLEARSLATRIDAVPSVVYMGNDVAKELSDLSDCQTVEIPKTLKSLSVSEIKGDHYWGKIKAYDGEQEYYSDKVKDLIEEKLISIFGDKKVVNLGGGQNSHGLSCVNVDINESLNGENLVRADLDLKNFQLPFKDDSFEGAVMVETLFYINNIEELFKEIGRILKPGSDFVIIHREKAGAPDYQKIRYFKSYLEVRGYISLIYRSVEETNEVIKDTLKNANFEDHSNQVMIENFQGGSLWMTKVRLMEGCNIDENREFICECFNQMV